MDLTHLHPWNVEPKEAVRLQRELRKRLVHEPPTSFEARLVAGADVSLQRFGRRGYAGIVTIDVAGMETVEESGAASAVPFPYVPGLLSFRELPMLAAAWMRLERRPDALIFDAHGTAHPRRMGLACHGGLLFDVPSVGCAKSLLVGEHGALAAEPGSTAELVHEGEVVGMAVRLRAGVKPVYVSPGHLMDLPTAVRVVQSVAAGYRLPETTRRAHRLVNRIRESRPGG